MYNKDVKQLLDHCNGEIENISEQAKNGEINKVILKNTLENMRSILDYVAQDILHKLKQNQKNKKLSEKVYFPYGQKESHFKNSVKKNLSSLKHDEPELYDLIEASQPFKSGDSWIVYLCLLTNEAKHNNLSKTKEQKSVSVKQGNFIHIEGGSNITLHNNYVNGIRQDDIHVDNNGEVTVVEHSGNTEITINNRIKFHGKELEIVPFLQNCHVKLHTLTNKIGVILHEKA